MLMYIYNKMVVIHFLLAANAKLYECNIYFNMEK